MVSGGKRIVLTSLMRDMYVPIPGYSDNRINAAYAFGGMTLLDRDRAILAAYRLPPIPR